jgi:microcystin-dependent protein
MTFFVFNKHKGYIMKNICKTFLLGTALSASLMTTSTTVQACSPEPYIGSICAFGGNFAIRGYASANGQLLPINTNTALFSILGTTYGGDGRTTFGLPDLRGRAAVGWGNGPGLSNIGLGQRGGSESFALTNQQLPNHTHTLSNVVVTNNLDFSASTAVLRAFSGNASSNSPTGNVLADSPRRENIYASGVPNVDMGSEAIALDIQASGDLEVSGTIGTTGGNQPVFKRSPYLGVTYLIATQGFFPPRN